MIQDQQERERQEADIARMQTQQLKEQQQENEDLRNDMMAAMSNPAMQKELGFWLSDELVDIEKLADMTTEEQRAAADAMIKMGNEILERGN